MWVLVVCGGEGRRWVSVLLKKDVDCGCEGNVEWDLMLRVRDMGKGDE